MEVKIEKCSFTEHNQVEACSYCHECKIYMCNKCSIHHKGLCKNHHQYNLKQDFNNIFIETCKEENHNLKLEYYCKSHNILCCDSCITKIKYKGKGEHKDCDIILLEDIKEEKKNNLSENIKILEELSNNLENSINELKILSEKIDEKKEDIKMKIQKIFTNIRNEINEREDKLLSEVEEKFNNLFIKEELIRKFKNLPKKAKLTLDKCYLINKEWKKDENLNSVINDCINLEDNIKDRKSVV